MKIGTEVQVTLKLSAREALLLKALINGMGFTEDDGGARASAPAIASVLRPGTDLLSSKDCTELEEFCDELFGSLSGIEEVG